jgi:hypothetical protein
MRIIQQAANLVKALSQDCAALSCHRSRGPAHGILLR